MRSLFDAVQKHLEANAELESKLPLKMDCCCQSVKVRINQGLYGK